jgi:hypothetical protein
MWVDSTGRDGRGEYYEQFADSFARAVMFLRACPPNDSVPGKKGDDFLARRLRTRRPFRRRPKNNEDDDDPVTEIEEHLHSVEDC